MELQVNSSVKSRFSEQLLGSTLKSLLATSPCSRITSASGSTNRPAVVWVAYSGGLDSHVLLAAVANLFSSSFLEGQSAILKAVHINHGLSPNAGAWQAHCESVCSALNIPLVTQKVTINSGASIEAVARQARYRVFDELLSINDCLLMAHHQDDQLETMLFRLLRGAGLKGLAAIPAQRALKKGRLLRPLLNFSRDDLKLYADANELIWVKDESNLDKRFDRNFLRHEIFPLLKQRWPGFANNWQRTAQICAEADHLQKVLAMQDMEMVKTEHAYRLDINTLKQLEPIRQRNILRYWLLNLETDFALPAPGFHCLQRIVSEILPAGADANPLVSWSDGGVGAEIRRFAGHLYALKTNIDDADLLPLNWNPAQVLTLPGSLGRLSTKAVTGKGVDISAISNLRIAFRQGGEQVKPAGRKTRSLKKIFQDYQVPPWLRDKVPLIYAGDELVAVADIFICEKWQVENAHKLHCFCWDRVDIHCGY